MHWKMVSATVPHADDELSVRSQNHAPKATKQACDLS